MAEGVLAAEDGRGTLAGFAAAWRNEGDLVIGPLVADDLAVARTLITAVASEENGFVRVDIRGAHLELATWAAARGLIPCGSATLMVHGGKLPGLNAMPRTAGQRRRAGLAQSRRLRPRR